MNNYSKLLNLKHIERIQLPSPFAPLIFQVKSKTCLNACILGLNLLNDLAKRAEALLSLFSLIALLIAT